MEKTSSLDLSSYFKNKKKKEIEATVDNSIDKIDDTSNSDVEENESGINLSPVVDINIDNNNTEEQSSNESDPIIGPEDDPIRRTVEAYKTFDSVAWNKKTGYKLPHFPFIQKKIEGLDEGLYLFAAESNAGKTSLMSNILYDACTCKENKLLGLYFSLDDSKQLVIPRIISMIENIPILASAKPHTFKELYDKTPDDNPNKAIYKSYLNKREHGLNKLINQANCFQVRDNSDKIADAEDIYKYIQSMITYVKAMFGDDYNVIVAIDALDDIRFRNGKFQSDTDRHKMIAKTVKDWATEFHIPIFGSRHLNKIRMDRKPVLDDLKDTSEYVYEATMVWLLYNEVGKKGQSASVYYTKSDQQSLPENQREKQPVIEINWAKNKASSYKGKSYCYFVPEFSKMIEVPESEKSKYDALAY